MIDDWSCVMLSFHDFLKSCELSMKKLDLIFELNLLLTKRCYFIVELKVSFMQSMLVIRHPA